MTVSNAKPAARAASPQTRLVALDGLRGLAAFAVMQVHVTRGGLPAHGGLAVDIFFLMSGFVLASAYETRLKGGMTFRTFAAQRLARLYPLYLFGLVVGLALALPRFGGEAVRSFAAALLFCSWPGGPAHEAAFWLDGPMWSLSLEILVNLLFAAGLWRLSNRAMAVIPALAAGVLAVAALRYGTVEFGYFRDPADYALGYARVMLAFPLGWLIWRLRGRLTAGCTPRASVIALIAVAVSFAWDAGLAALVAVCVLYPLAIIALALAPQPTGALGRAAAILGALSYPLYVVHAHVVVVVGSLVTGPARTPAIWVLATALAWALHKSLEPVGRRLLSRLFARRGAGEMRPAPA